MEIDGPHMEINRNQLEIIGDHRASMDLNGNQLKSIGNHCGNDWKSMFVNGNQLKLEIIGSYNKSMEIN